MADVSVVAVITAKAGHGDEVEEMLRGLAESTHGEDGCVLYSLQRGLEDRDVFVTVEKWASQEELQAHLAGPGIAAAMAKGGALLAGAPQIIPAEMLSLGDPAKATY
jgi:quinol monooxygenase YgiN